MLLPKGAARSVDKVCRKRATVFGRWRIEGQGQGQASSALNVCGLGGFNEGLVGGKGRARELRTSPGVQGNVGVVVGVVPSDTNKYWTSSNVK